MKILFSKREDKMYSLEYISTASSYNHVFRITNKLYERDYVFTASLTELKYLREIELENLWFFAQLIDNDERHVFVEATMNDGDFSPTIRRYMQINLSNYERNCAELVKCPERLRIVETKNLKYPLSDKYLIGAIISVPDDTDKSDMRNVLRQKLEDIKDNAFAIANGICLNEGETENANF